jgi:hypothetical protein
MPDLRRHVRRRRRAIAKKMKQALALRSQGIGIRRIAREVGLGISTVNPVG